MIAATYTGVRATSMSRCSTPALMRCRTASWAHRYRALLRHSSRTYRMRSSSKVTKSYSGTLSEAVVHHSKTIRHDLVKLCGTAFETPRCAN